MADKFSELFLDKTKQVEEQLVGGKNVTACSVSVLRRVSKLEAESGAMLRKLFNEELIQFKKSEGKDSMPTRKLYLEFLKMLRSMSALKKGFAAKLQNDLVPKFSTFNDEYERECKRIIKDFKGSRKNLGVIRKTMRSKNPNKIKAVEEKTIEFLEKAQELEEDRIETFKTCFEQYIKYNKSVIEQQKILSMKVDQISSSITKSNGIKYFCDKKKIDSISSESNRNRIGMTLEELMQLTENMHRDFPKIIEDCCDAIERKNGFKTQGIFRISCRSEELKRAIDNANSGNYDFAEFESPHVPAVFLKTLFKEMREPVIPNQIVDECAQFGSTNGKENSLTSKTEFEMILKKIPEKGKAVLKHMAVFLTNLAQNEKITKMDLSNLAIVFTPTLTRIETTKDISKMMLINDHLQTFVVYLLLYYENQKSELAVPPPIPKKGMRRLISVLKSEDESAQEDMTIEDFIVSGKMDESLRKMEVSADENDELCHLEEDNTELS